MLFLAIAGQPAARSRSPLVKKLLDSSAISQRQETARSQKAFGSKLHASTISGKPLKFWRFCTQPPESIPCHEIADCVTPHGAGHPCVTACSDKLCWNWLCTPLNTSRKLSADGALFPLDSLVSNGNMQTPLMTRCKQTLQT